MQSKVVTTGLLIDKFNWHRSDRWNMASACHYSHTQQCAWVKLGVLNENIAQIINTYNATGNKRSFYLLRKHVKVGACGASHSELGRLEAPEDILQSCSNKEILLFQTQLLAFKELQMWQIRWIMWH